MLLNVPKFGERLFRIHSSFRVQHRIRQGPGVANGKSVSHGYCRSRLRRLFVAKVVHEGACQIVLSCRIEFLANLLLGEFDRELR